MAGEIDIDTVAKAYARWAPVYDLVFGAVFDAGRKASIAAAERIGGRILDVGIGTGISLTDYAPAHRIVGVDYSEPMLRKAHERVAAHHPCRGAGGDGRAAFGLPDVFEWSGSPRCLIPKPRSTSWRA
jgi:SAM-dependent methyltransferase